MGILIRPRAHQALELVVPGLAAGVAIACASSYGLVLFSPLPAIFRGCRSKSAVPLRGSRGPITAISARGSPKSFIFSSFFRYTRPGLRPAAFRHRPPQTVSPQGTRESAVVKSLRRSALRELRERPRHHQPQVEVLDMPTPRAVPPPTPLDPGTSTAVQAVVAAAETPLVAAAIGQSGGGQSPWLRPCRQHLDLDLGPRASAR